MDIYPIEIKRADRGQVKSVVGLHKVLISNGPVSEIVLEHYYSELLDRSDCALYVAIDNQQVIGYASLVKSQRLVMARAMLLHGDFWSQTFAQFSTFPTLFKYVLNKVFHEYFGGKWGKKSNRLPNVCELRAIAVESKYQGRGVAAALLELSIVYARHNHLMPVIAWVAADNLPSQHLFKRVGFKKIATPDDLHRPVVLYSIEE